MEAGSNGQQKKVSPLNEQYATQLKIDFHYKI
jgi:hypothetical protein